MTSSTSLKGKVAVITGASSGIGTSTAHALDDAGMNLVLVARSKDKLEGIAKDLSSASVLPLDVTDDHAAGEIIDHAHASFGALDVLINNAGMMAVGNVDDLDVDNAMAMVRLNVEAAFRLAICTARKMKAANSGDIINISSVAGLKTFSGMSVYNGTKFAMDAFSDALRMELAEHGVRVAAVEPGTVNTNLYAEWHGDDKERVSNSGMLEPDDIARTIRFMLEQPPHMTIARLFTLPSRHGI